MKNSKYIKSRQILLIKIHYMLNDLQYLLNKAKLYDLANMVRVIENILLEQE